MPSRNSGTARQAFGVVLRTYRERAGLSRAELAARIYKSESLIEAIERGERVATEDVTRDLEGVPELGTGGVLADLRSRFGDTLNYQQYPPWFQDWAIYEREAVALRTFELAVVPGLLQTEDYARAIFRTRLKTTDEQIEELVAARMKRQEILARGDPPMLWVLLDEAVLRREVGGRHVMCEQMNRLTEAARRPSIVIHVIPSSVGAHLGLLGAFVIADLKDAASVGYQETPVGSPPVEDPGQVAELDLIWNTLRSEALPRAASLALLEEAAKSWTSAA